MPMLSSKHLLQMPKLHSESPHCHKGRSSHRLHPLKKIEEMLSRGRMLEQRLWYQRRRGIMRRQHHAGKLFRGSAMAHLRAKLRLRKLLS